MAVVGVIPARGGSKGIPRKNVLAVAGKPLIGYVIEAAKSARTLDLVVVSTEDDEIAAVAATFGVRVIRRPAALATDTAPVDPALRHVVRTLEAEGCVVDIVVWLQANVPTTRAEIIDAAVDKLRSSGADSVQTVVPYRVPPQWSWRLEGDRLVPLEGCQRFTVRRQEAVPAFHLDGSVNALRRDVLMSTEGMPGAQDYFGRDRRAIVQDPRASVEVDEPMDLDLVRVLFSEGRGRA